MSRDINDFLVELTDSDEFILKSYMTMCDCLSTYLGGGYEIVLHSLGIDDFFIRKIINGHYSGRSAGTRLKDYPVNAIVHLYEKLEDQKPPVSVYFSENDEGEVFRSATTGIIGSGNKLIGLLCFNFYLSTPISEVVERLYPPKGVIMKKSQLSSYTETDEGYEPFIKRAVKEAERTVLADQTIPSKYRKKEIIRILHNSGLFNVKDSVDICAKLLGIRKTTVYMHLRNISD